MAVWRRLSRARRRRQASSRFPYTRARLARVVRAARVSSWCARSPPNAPSRLSAAMDSGARARLAARSVATASWCRRRSPVSPPVPTPSPVPRPSLGRLCLPTADHASCHPAAAPPPVCRRPKALWIRAPPPPALRHLEGAAFHAAAVQRRQHLHHPQAPAAPATAGGARERREAFDRLRHRAHCSGRAGTIAGGQRSSAAATLPDGGSRRALAPASATDA